MSWRGTSRPPDPGTRRALLGALVLEVDECSMHGGIESRLDGVGWDALRDGHGSKVRRFLGAD